MSTAGPAGVSAATPTSTGGRAVQDEAGDAPITLTGSGRPDGGARPGAGTAVGLGLVAAVFATGALVARRRRRRTP